MMLLRSPEANPLIGVEGHPENSIRADQTAAVFSFLSEAASHFHPWVPSQYRLWTLGRSAMAKLPFDQSVEPERFILGHQFIELCR